MNYFSEAYETINWINEKKAAISPDVGSNLTSVSTLQRKHEALERDLAALSDKVQYHILTIILNKFHCLEP